jgi:hypothetical protein
VISVIETTREAERELSVPSDILFTRGPEDEETYSGLTWHVIGPPHVLNELLVCISEFG